jgi:tripartite-type tricarboxylate transporter receptor subunit TctC
MDRRGFVASSAALALALPFSRAALAQAFPDKPVRLVVPFPPGGSNDVIGRIVAQALGERLGQQVIVENKGGAGGIIGTEAVAKAEPDGYTLIIGAVSTFAGNPSLHQNLSFDVMKDFTAIAPVARGPFLLAVPAEFPAKTTEELIKLAKEKPGSINFGSSGVGSSLHLVSELFRTRAGIDVTHVPYKGLGPAMTDLLSGRIQFIFSDMSPLVPYIEAGKLRALGVSTEGAFAALPDLRPLTTSGAPGFVASGWYGILGPAKMPQAVVARLHKELTAIAEDPAMKERFAKLGVSPWISSPAEFHAFIGDEVKKWTEVVKTANIKPE